jgi:hypothetical protein
MSEAVAVSMAEPTASMRTSFAGLEEECRALLIAMLDSHESTISLKEELASAFERHLGRPPHRSATTAAEIVDEHFLRLAQWDDPEATEPSHAEWVHPSVRDMVIGHLMEDAAARRSFLGRAGIDGVMLALSSSGGAEGKRRFPLLEGGAEWDEIERRVIELAENETTDTLERVLALLGDTARLSRSITDREEKKRLVKLTRSGLDALREQWATSGDRILNPELRNFYRASAYLPKPVQGPNVTETWKQCVEESRVSIRHFVEEMMQCTGKWLDLAELLEQNDSEQLERLSFPQAYGELLEQIVEKLEDEEQGLDTPVVSNEDDPREYEEAPPELEWINGTEELLIAVANFSPALKQRCENVTSYLFDKASEWDEYGERYTAFNEPEPDYDYEGGRGYSADGESFSVGSVFSDL